MRLTKFLFIAFFVTLLALGYVHQQSRIFYLAYLNGKKQATLANLLDKNNLFRYNINRLSSLAHLDNKILRNLDFEMPSEKHLVRFSPAEKSLATNPGSAKRTNLIINFFGRARQAQAQNLNR